MASKNVRQEPLAQDAGQGHGKDGRPYVTTERQNLRESTVLPAQASVPYDSPPPPRSGMTEEMRDREYCGRQLAVVPHRCLEHVRLRLGSDIKRGIGIGNGWAVPGAHSAVFA